MKKHILLGLACLLILPLQAASPARQQAEADVRTARAQLDSAEARLLKEEADYNRIRADLTAAEKRYREAYALRGAAQTRLNTARNRLANTR